MNLTRRTGARAAVLVAAGLLSAACGSSSKTASSGSTTSTTAGTSAGGSTTLATHSTSLGSVVVDAASGRTLYHYDKDTAGSGSSACTGACANNWPAETVSGTPSAGTGVVGTLSTIPAVLGGTQVTLDGHPLYEFSGDKAAGDTNGNGLGGVWHVIMAGSAIGAASTGGSGTSTTAAGYHY